MKRILTERVRFSAEGHTANFFFFTYFRFFDPPKDDIRKFFEHKIGGFQFFLLLKFSKSDSYQMFFPEYLIKYGGF